MNGLIGEYATKVMYKIEKYDEEQGKRVVVNKTFDKVNRDMEHTTALSELGNFIVDAIGGESLLETVLIRYDNVM